MSLSLGLANTPFINYLFYKQATFISTTPDTGCHAIVSIADGGNGQLVVTTDDTTLLSAGVAITITGTTSYDGNYSIISLTPTTFNISGIFGSTETGCWNLATGMTGADVGDPLDFGTITFYNATNQTTLQSTYKDRDLMVLNTNPVVLDAVGSSPPIYLQDIPYYIEIKDKFNNMVTTLENYLPGGGSATPTNQQPFGNLLSNYGFDTRINENIYKFESVPPVSTTTISTGWIWEIDTTQTNPENTYEYIELANSGLTGNPKNELVLKTTNNLGGQTTNNLYTIIGDYNALQDQNVAFSIYTRLISGSATTLPLSLVRTKNGVPEPPIDLMQSIDISQTRSQEIKSFKIPLLSTSDYDNNDELRLVIGLPLNEDFQMAFTGTWLQLSSDGSVTIAEIGGSEDAARQFFGKSFRDLQSDPQYDKRALPVSIGLGGTFILPTTGTIFLSANGAASDYSEFAASMLPDGNEGFGVELIRDEEIGKTQTNRLIDYLREHNLTQSRLTFIAAPDGVTTNQVNVSTGIGTPESTTWNSLATPRITVTKDTDELIYKLNALPIGNGQINLTFVDQFSATTNAYSPNYGGGGAAFSVLPPSAPIINWFGGAWWPGANIGDPQMRFYSRLEQTTVNGGSATENAKMTFRIVRNQNVDQIHNAGVTFATTNVAWVAHISHPLYDGTVVERDYNGENTNFGINYFGYNDINDNPAIQDFQPPRVIRFNGDAPTGNGPFPNNTLTITSLGFDDSGSLVVKKMSEAINTSFIYHLTIVSTPNNGDVVEISNAQTDFNLIFYDTGLTRPTNPSGIRKPIYVEFSSAQTLAQIAQSTADALQNGVMGVPRAADLGLEWPTELQYYMIL